MREIRSDWTLSEVEIVVDDYLEMLSSELAGVSYNKAARRRALLPRLNGRSEQSVEFKRANISAALLELEFPFIAGYKPRSNYQQLLAEVVERRLSGNARLLEIAAVDADRPMVVPDVSDLLSVLIDAPHFGGIDRGVRETPTFSRKLTTNYIEREAQNRSLGSAGEEFVINFERARLIRAGRESLASKIEHTSRVRGDGEGYDILSFESDGAERLIEVKTTKYGKETPFFVTRNEVAVSEKHSDLYHVYRLFCFRHAPGLFTLAGAIDRSCSLSAATFVALPR